VAGPNITLTTDNTTKTITFSSSGGFSNPIYSENASTDLFLQNGIKVGVSDLFLFPALPLYNGTVRTCTNESSIVSALSSSVAGDQASEASCISVECVSNFVGAVFLFHKLYILGGKCSVFDGDSNGINAEYRAHAVSEF